MDNLDNRKSIERGENRSHAMLDTPDSLNRESYSISDLSSDFDVTARALRFYEDQGLIAPERPRPFPYLFKA